MMEAMLEHPEKTLTEIVREIRATLKAGTAEWRNGGMAENDPKS